MKLQFLLLSALILGVTECQGKSCPVGEIITHSVGGGLCNSDDGDARCDGHCKQQYKDEHIGSSCAARTDGKRECICQLKCQSAGAWGDPHFTTFDNVGHHYQGKCLQTTMKLRTKPETLPTFEIQQTNKQWSGALSIIDIITLKVPDWDLTIAISEDTTSVMVNGKKESLPYTFSTIERKYIENFVKVKSENGVLVETSFGLRINRRSYYLTVDIPRHPELRGNTAGLLGIWDDDASNDLTDASGNVQPNDWWVWNFGNSWCVDTSAQTEIDTIKKAADERDKTLKACALDTGRKRNAEELCKKLDNPKIIACMGSAIVNDCGNDLCFLTGKKDQTDYICPLITAANERCGTTITC